MGSFINCIFIIIWKKLVEVTRLTSLLGILIFTTFAFHQSAYSLDEDQLYCFYDQVNLAGQAQCGQKRHQKYLGFQWSNTQASVEIKSGYEMVVFPYPWYWGQPKVLSGTQANLSTSGVEQLGSFYLRHVSPDQDKICFYSKKHYQGARFCTVRSRAWLSWFWNNRISSVSIPAGYEVTLFNRWFYRGGAITLTSSTPELANFNNRTSSFYIQSVTTTNDQDSDGVADDADQCPETPLGEMVDSQGCALSQLDTDNDGVDDGADQCPQTPDNENANDEGCALSQLDADEDSISDADDLCPATPEDELPNEQGCSDSQLDTDGDTVNDALDTCPETSEGEAIDSQGCSLSQLDSDNDGINDAVDQCPGTAPNNIVNPVGCSTAQLLS